MKNLIQNTIDRIKKEHIAPEPRWKFVLRKTGSWALVGLVVFSGAAAIAASYYLVSQLDWDLYRFAHRNAFFYALPMIPYFWLVALGLFMAAAFFGVRRTENGYRFNGLWITLAIIVGFLLVGFFMARAGLGGRFNDIMLHKMPFYAQSVETKEEQWMQPEKGFLAGTIGTVSTDGLTLDDLEGERWNVQLEEETLVRPSADIASGQMVKIIGTKKAARDFSAAEIRPWTGRGMSGAGGGSQGSCGAGESGSCGNRGGMMRGR